MVKHFEELDVWQMARELVNHIYDMDVKQDLGLRDQIRRASVSVMSNIAEGFERNGNNEFIQFLYIAKGSCGEVRCQLYISQDRMYLSPEKAHALIRKATDISIRLANLIKHLRNSGMSGPKYKQRALPSIKDITDEIMKELNNDDI